MGDAKQVEGWRSTAAAFWRLQFPGEEDQSPSPTLRRQQLDHLGAYLALLAKARLELVGYRNAYEPSKAVELAYNAIRSSDPNVKSAADLLCALLVGRKGVGALGEKQGLGQDAYCGAIKAAADALEGQ